MAKKENVSEEKRTARSDSIIEFQANRSVVVEGCRGIMEYSDTCIRVSTRRMTLKFEGRNLEIISMSPDAIAIEGYIISLSFDA